MEEELIKKIEAGDLNDEDITLILTRGSAKLKKIFNERVNRLVREKEHFARVTGIATDSFDGIDNNGNPFKDEILVDHSTEEYTEEKNFLTQ